MVTSEMPTNSIPFCIPDCSAAPIGAERKVKHAALVLRHRRRSPDQGGLVVGDPVAHRSEGADVEALRRIFNGEEWASQNQDRQSTVEH